MEVRHIVLPFIFISLSTKTSAQCQNGALSKNLIASALQDILSSSNTESAMQMLRMATGQNRKTLIPEAPVPARTVLPKAVETIPMQAFMKNDIPRAIVTNEMPCAMRNKDLRILRPTEMVMPRVIASNEVAAFMNPNEMVMPRVVANNDMRAFMDPYETRIQNKDILIGPSEIVMPRAIRYIMPDAYERQIYGKAISDQYSKAFENRMMNYSPMMGEEVLCPCAQSSVVNPFLPIASPVSAFSPTTSNNLPPPTQGRSQYLRKIPIPPPTL